MSYQVSLAEPGLFVLDPEVKMRQHVKTRRQKLKTGGHDGQFALLGLARMSDCADDVASSQLGHDSQERLLTTIVRLSVGHHLDGSKLNY